VLEDAAEAHGAEYGVKKAGALGNCAIFSFFGNKIVTTGEGGMITTDDSELAARVRLFRGQGMDPNRRYWFPVVGYNYRMTNIQAAIGVAQMERIEESLEFRKKMASWYNEDLAHMIDDLVLPEQSKNTRHVYWMYNIFLRTGDAGRRDEVMRRLDAAGIETRPVFYPMHVMPPYRENVSYPVADEWAQRGINLPSHEGLARADISRIADSLQNALSGK